MTSHPAPSARIWAMLFLLAFIWGGSFLFARIAVLEIPPLTLVLLRVALASLTLNAVLIFWRTGFTHNREAWKNFAIMGVLNNIIPFLLIFIGQKEIGAGLAAIVNAMTPIWTVLIAHQTTSDERMSAPKVVGIILGFAGVATLIGSAAFAGLEASAWAQLSVLGATISYGFASVFGKRFAEVPPMETARGQLTASTILIAPLALLWDQPWALPMPSALAIWSVIALAVICSAFAYILFFEILSKAGAVNVSLVTFLVPPSAIVLGMIFLGETLETRHIVGMALILSGLIAIDGRLWKRIAPR
ncbi:DMT family transporter [Ahrensia sp. R2A130]|uniref:DMT family transporter n=1 Tax=Ahrensia sp. R2A130 TaxID=744979 RepID=UPI0001E0D0BC|nr:DMT family transporter [Ahrensia sp. R2A130]EFL90861.1 ABC transporter, membrane spanning protein [Ahrensia sp. R2A130]